MDKIDELITDLVRKVSNLGKDCYCEGDYMQQQSEIDDVRAALRAEYERLQARIAWFETALDTKELVYTKFLSDYQDAKAYIKNLDAAVDKLCPLVARACTKLTPPTIGAVNIADFTFAREMRNAMNEVTKVQNGEVKDDLIPCPFCGGNDCLWDQYGYPSVACLEKCKSADEVEQRWKTRPIEDALQARITDLERRLINLTDAIEDFLNDVREKPAVEKIERAMNDYGMKE